MGNECWQHPTAGRAISEPQGKSVLSTDDQLYTGKTSTVLNFGSTFPPGVITVQRESQLLVDIVIQWGVGGTELRLRVEPFILF